MFERLSNRTTGYLLGYNKAHKKNYYTSEAKDEL